MLCNLLLLVLCPPRRDERGQATAEYALVLLAAAAIAMAVVSFVGRTHLITNLLESVFGQLIHHTKAK
jgi:Flp pilus assembly pilin Flp